MAIYGTALLSICLLSGLIVGKLLGQAMGIEAKVDGVKIEANIGGVGIAMLLLILVSGRLQARGWMPKPTQNGVLFWSSLYIPIVVAMAASQNVRAAVSGGAAAIVAGTLVVIASFAMVPLISRLGRPDSDIDTDIASSKGEKLGPTEEAP